MCLVVEVPNKDATKSVATSCFALFDFLFCLQSRFRHEYANCELPIEAVPPRNLSGKPRDAFLRVSRRSKERRTNMTIVHPDIVLGAKQLTNQRLKAELIVDVLTILSVRPYVLRRPLLRHRVSLMVVGVCRGWLRDSRLALSAICAELSSNSPSTTFAGLPSRSFNTTFIGCVGDTVGGGASSSLGGGHDFSLAVRDDASTIFNAGHGFSFKSTRVDAFFTVATSPQRQMTISS